MITVESVSYEYPNVRALSDVSLTIEQGAIAALIGPNGAGKTTLLRCLAALERPYSGQITIDGICTDKDPRGVHRRIGYLSDFFGVYTDLTVERCLRYAARAGGVAEADVSASVTRIAERVGLADRLDTVAGTLSRGLRQRLGIAQAMIHAPAVLLLDEPASGLDPEARHDLSVLFKTLRDEGATLVVSSHILAELEDYATEVIFIRDGHIVQHAQLGEETGDSVRMQLDLAEPAAGLEAMLTAIEGVTVESVDESGAIIVVGASTGARQAVLQKFMEAGLPVSGFAVVRERLQESYLSFVEELEEKGE